MMKAIAVEGVRCLLAVMIFLSFDICSVSAQQRQRIRVSSISYSLKEPVSGYQDEVIGNLNVCVVITDGIGSDRTISLHVKMPDSFQALSVTAPITQLSNGDILFEFTNDGWGNVGRGTLKEVSGKMQLDLIEIDSPPEADRNIGRNYGTYLLDKIACRQ